MRVLIHSWRDHGHPEAGGAEKYITTVAEGLADVGHDITFRTARYPGSVATEVVGGVRYVRSGGRYSIYPRALARQALDRSEFDAVIDVQNGMPYLSPLVRKAPTINLVHHVHREQWPVVFGDQVARLGWLVESRLAPMVYRSTQYVTVSGASRDELARLGVPASRIRVIHNGTDAARDEAVTRSPTPVVVVLSRLVPQKRIEIAIDAVAALATRIPNLTLRILGSGWWEQHLRDHVVQAGVQNRTTFHGHVSEAEKHRHLAEGWVLALPSIKEGWGLVVVEAGVHGTPTVAFEHAQGTRDSIRDRETGLLCGPGTEAFTDALGAVLTERRLRAELSRNVEDWVGRFSWSDCVAAWIELLDEVARDRRCGPSTARRT